MKQAAKKILSFVIVVCLAFIGVFTAPVVGVKAEDNGTWELVTDASDLEVEDKVIIAATGYNFALSTTQNTNNRGQAAITKSGDTVTFGNDVQILTLKAGTINGTFAFYTGSGYLYAASSSSNYLRTGTLNDNSSWQITITSTGVATIKAQGTYTNNWLRYNATNKLFSCYGSGQKDVCLYKLEANVDSTAPSIKISSPAQNYMQVGETITLEATLTNVEGTVVWASDNTDVATVGNGVVTAKAMGTTTITAKIGEVSDTVDVIIYPEADTEISIADALKVCELTGNVNSPYNYSTVGTIESIGEVYTTQYNNITVTITDGTNSIQAYRMDGGSDLAVGTKITVTGTLINYNSNTPEFIAGSTYKIVEDDGNLANIKEALSEVSAYMSLSYKYKQETEEQFIAATTEVVFELGADGTGGHSDGSTSKATYSETVSGYTLNITGGTNMYTDARDAKGNSCIKLGTSKLVGGFSFTVPSDVTGVIIAVAQYKANITKISVNGTDYTIETASDNGEYTKIEVDTSSEKTVSLTTDSDYKRAMVNSITYVVKGASTGETEEVTVLKESDFRFRCGVDASLAEIEGIDGYGIRVTAGDKFVDYTAEDKFWTADGEIAYVVISLGDIINDTDKLNTEFTVQAYVVVDGITYVSESKTHSVASMVEEYYDDGTTEVAHLYEYLKEVA